MPAETPPPVELDQIQQQIEKLSLECAALSAAFARARQVRILILVALIGFAAIVCFAFYNLGQGFLKPEFQQELTKAAQKRLEANQKQYMHEVELLVKNTSPAVTDAFSRQATKDSPVYLKLLDRERDQMAKDLEAELTERMQKRYEASLARHDKILREEFPESQDPVKHERMTANLKLALDRLLQKYYVAELERRLKELFAAWDKFPAADMPKPGERPLEQEFAAEFFYLLSIKLGGAQTVVK